MVRDMIIKNGNVFGVDGTFSKRDVAFENGMFTVSSSEEIEIDATDLYVSPGLTDIHFHGCMGHDFCEGTSSVIQTIADYEESVGVTTICPATMTMSPETLLQIAKAVKEFPNQTGAELVGINMEGPFIAMNKKGAQNPKYIHKPDAPLFDQIQSQSGNMVKLVDIAPETEGAMEFIEKEHGNTVISIAHTEADYQTATEAFQKGASHMTHLYNAMNPISHRAPGPIIAAADTDFVEAEIICDNIHIHPAVVRNTFKMFGKERMILISDTMEAVGMPDGEYQLGGQAVTKKGNRATLHDGTIAGSATNLMDCMKTVVKQMNIPLETAVYCAAVTPARSIGIYDRYGSIETGKSANFVLLDKELNTVAVYNRGKKIEKV